MYLLNVEELSVSFGGVQALSRINLGLRPGEIRGLIGPNGAGKTTFFNLVGGFLRPSSGTIRFSGQDITGRPPHLIARLGVARTYQNLRLFNEMTVLENVVVGGYCRMPIGLAGSLLRTGRVTREEQEIRSRACQILKFLGLIDRSRELARNLPYGRKKVLELARALATEPRLLLLDEPTAGMNPEETDAMIEVLRKVRDQGYSLLIIEHDMRMIMGLCDLITVLNFGQVIAEGPAAAIQNDPSVIEAYLGKRRGTP